MTQFEKAISINELAKATKRCCKGRMCKDTARLWKLETTTKCVGLADSLEAGAYKPSHGGEFMIWEPKLRRITPPLFRDRVFQNSICNNGVYDDLTKFLIYDNNACQKGKGTEHAVLRMTAFLERYFRKFGNNRGYALHLDVKKYFPSTPHEIDKELVRKRISDRELIKQIEAIIDSFEDERSSEEIKNDSFGKRNIGLGSPISQLMQLALLNHIDQRVSRMDGVFAYSRHMDDIIVICISKETCKRVTDYVNSEMSMLGLTMTNKGGAHRLDRGFYYLQKKFILTDTGKVIILPKHSKITKERRILRELKRQVDGGEKTIQDVRRHYESFMSGLMLLNCRETIKRLDGYYEELFGEKPQYKCKPKSRRKK